MAGSAPRRPTLADVARLSGMSPAAVSLILNDRPGSRLSAEADLAAPPPGAWTSLSLTPDRVDLKV